MEELRRIGQRACVLLDVRSLWEKAEDVDWISSAETWNERVASIAPSELTVL
jgi:hypothetical protein